jgi:cardiolipin synthase A/B
MDRDLSNTNLLGDAFSVAGHQIRVQHAPQDRWDAMLQMIEQAQHSIRMLSYIFLRDASGTAIRDALIAAAGRGVMVSLIIDSFGSTVSSDAFFSPIEQAGGRYLWFSSRWNIGYFVRNHQKILIVDELTAAIGGYNIADSYFGKAGNKSWEDFGMTISGPQIPALGDYFDQLFAMTEDGGVRFLELRNLIRKWRPGSGPVQVLLGGPTNRISPWARRLIRDLDLAQRFDAVAAYFSPTQSILRRIGKVARRGKARLILAGKSDNIATISASRILYGYLLKRGTQICEFQPRPLHMKLLVIDDASYVGSSNLDARSLFINMEIMVRIDDAGLAKHLRGLIDDMTADSEVQDIERHKKRATWINRLRWTVAFFLVSSIDYSVGKRIRFRFLRGK